MSFRGYLAKKIKEFGVVLILLVFDVMSYTTSSIRFMNDLNNWNIKFPALNKVTDKSYLIQQVWQLSTLNYKYTEFRTCELWMHL